MSSLRSTIVASLGVASAVFLSAATADAQVFKTLANQPQSGGSNAVIEGCNLLTDGSVVCLETSSNQWHRLRPNASGSYLNGTWDNIAPMPDGVDTRLTGLDVTQHPPVLTGVDCNPCTYSPRFFASAVLEDGRMIVIGGEDLGTRTIAQVVKTSGSGQVQTNIGFVYNPANNTWSSQLNSAFASGTVGDAVSVVLPDKRFVVANINNGDMEAFDPATNSLVALNPPGKLDGNDEEGWNLLPDNTFLAVDAGLVATFELFDPVANSWSHPGSSPNMFVNGSTTDTLNITDFPSLSARSPSFEVGPAVLRPDGKLVYFSGNESGQNGLYDSAAGTWSRSGDMDFPQDTATGTQISVPDGPAALLPNGDVLVLASRMGKVDCLEDGSPPMGFTICGTFNAPATVFRFKFDLTTGTTLEKLGTSDQPANAGSIAAFEGRFLVLPTGEVLFTTQDAVAGAQIYSNGETPLDAWRPVITTGPTFVNPGSVNNPISGRLFTGFSQGAGYGDDTQSYTNYPLVRITNNGTNHVVYAKTHSHSRMGLVSITNTDTVSTQFDVPSGTELGASCLQVVVNGIASVCQTVTVTNNRLPVALCKPFTAVANGVCLGSFTPADVDNGSFDPDGDALTRSVAPTGPFGLGPHTVTLTVSDPSGASDHCDAVVTVVDNTPPTLTPPPGRSIVTCSENTPVNIGQATATDNCASPLVPTATVIAKNGVPLVPPLPVVNGNVTLGIGTFTIQWSVSDGSNPPVTAIQTIVVGVNMQASQSFLVDDRAQVQNSGGGFAAVLNSGTGLTQIGNDSRSGGVLSVGNVRVLHRAVVNGGATSAGTVFKESDGTITGAITQNASVVLPPLPVLPAFPAPTAGSFTVNSGQTQTHAPGSYQSGTVNGGTLILAAGDYFFRSLTINSGSTVRVRPTTRIFVRDTLGFGASLLAAAGTAVQPIFLGYAGTADLGMLARFDGTLVAPNATVRFGTGAGLTFTGSFFAKVLEVTPASTLVCRVN